MVDNWGMVSRGSMADNRSMVSWGSVDNRSMVDNWGMVSRGSMVDNRGVISRGSVDKRGSMVSSTSNRSVSTKSLGLDNASLFTIRSGHCLVRGLSTSISNYWATGRGSSHKGRQTHKSLHDAVD